MRYLIASIDEINAINTAEAAERGCSGTTTMWYGTRLTAHNDWCLLIDDDKMIDGSFEHEPDWPVQEQA
jgi:hypothetical protein